MSGLSLFLNAHSQVFKCKELADHNHTILLPLILKSTCFLSYYLQNQIQLVNNFKCHL